MKLIDIPEKVQTPFADLAAPGFIRNIEQTTGIPGAASWEAGFPPQNMEPIASGGIPPFGQDMNGLMNAISSWTRWQSAGATVNFDAAFATEIGGYPAGAMIAALNGLGFWVSLVDDNLINPDTVQDGTWAFIQVSRTWAGDPNGSVSGMAASASNAPSLIWDTINLIFWYCTTTGNEATATWVPVVVFQPVTLNVTGASHNYILADNGGVFIRSNAGAAMADTLPEGIGNGWHITIINADATAILGLSPPAGKTIQGSAGTRQLRPTQNIEVTADAAGNFWITIPTIPIAFSGQAIYVNISGTYEPGVYDIDTSAGPITFTLEAGGALGDNYRINDIAGFFSINPCTVNGNGRTIEGDATMPLNVDWSMTTLTLPASLDWKAV